MNKEAPTPKPQHVAAPDPEDDESHIDGCDWAIGDATSDEDLPAPGQRMETCPAFAPPSTGAPTSLDLSLNLALVGTVRTL